MPNEDYNGKIIPSIKLAFKFYLYIILIPFMLAITFFPVIISIFLIRTVPEWLNIYQALITVGIYLLITIIVLYLIYMYEYCKTLEYEILENEIHVNRGILTRTKKIVPLRTITNISVKRSIWDRLLGIGTIEIQTAGSLASFTEVMNGLDASILIGLQEFIINQVRKISSILQKTSDNELINPSQLSFVTLNELKEIKTILSSHLEKTE